MADYHKRSFYCLWMLLWVVYVTSDIGYVYASVVPLSTPIPTVQTKAREVKFTSSESNARTSDLTICRNINPSAQDRCKEILQENNYAYVEVHDAQDSGLGGELSQSSTLHIVLGDIALYNPIEIKEGVSDVAIVGVAVEGVYPKLELSGLLWFGLDAMVRSKSGLFVDGLQINALGSYANKNGNVNHFIHVTGGDVELRNIQIHGAEESAKSVFYVENSGYLKVDNLEVWGDGHRNNLLFETKGVDEVKMNIANIHGFTAECVLFAHENSRKVSYKKVAFPIRLGGLREDDFYDFSPSIAVVYTVPQQYVAELDFSEVETTPSYSFEQYKSIVPLWVDGPDSMRAKLSLDSNSFDRSSIKNFLASSEASDLAETTSYYIPWQSSVPSCLAERYPLPTTPEYEVTTNPVLNISSSSNSSTHQATVSSTQLSDNTPSIFTSVEPTTFMDKTTTELKPTYAPSVNSKSVLTSQPATLLPNITSSAQISSHDAQVKPSTGGLNKASMTALWIAGGIGASAVTVGIGACCILNSKACKSFQVMGAKITSVIYARGRDDEDAVNMALVSEGDE